MQGADHIPVTRALRVLDLFSGIGGFSLGLERATMEGAAYDGFETVAFCEIEEFPRKVLAKHWPDVPCYHDVRELTAERLAADGIGPVEIITGGFPCQDISFAGKMAGISGERSGLWGEIVRLVGELRPRFVIVENVTALLSGERGQWFGRVLGDLAALGYDAEWHSIPSSSVGGASGRDRAWIVAHPGQEFGEVPGIYPGREGGEKQARRTPLENGDFYRLVRGVPVGVADYWWRAQSGVARTSDEIPHRLDRLAALGNTIDPFIPELIGRAILAAINETPQPARSYPAADTSGRGNHSAPAALSTDTLRNSGTAGASELHDLHVLGDNA